MNQYRKILEFIEFKEKQPEKVIYSSEIFNAIGIKLPEFEKILNSWAGLSFEQFLNFIHPKNNLGLINNNPQFSLFENNLQSSGKITSEFTKIIPMAEKEYGNKGSNLKINYEFYDSPFGQFIIGSTEKGVCYMAFEEEEESALRNIKSRFYNSEFTRKKDEFQADAISIFNLKSQKPIKLHIKGTEFQLQVWNQLLKIPMGQLLSYHQLAKQLNMPTASRAVGTAIGQNPIAYIVPCHRVVQSNGNFGGYRWGSPLKIMITAWEVAICRN